MCQNSVNSGFYTFDEANALFSDNVTAVCDLVQQNNNGTVNTLQQSTWTYFDQQGIQADYVLLNFDKTAAGELFQRCLAVPNFNVD